MLFSILPSFSFRERSNINITSRTKRDENIDRMCRIGFVYEKN